MSAMAAPTRIHQKAAKCQAAGENGGDHASFPARMNRSFHAGSPLNYLASWPTIHSAFRGSGYFARRKTCRMENAVSRAIVRRQMFLQRLDVFRECKNGNTGWVAGLC